MIAKLIWRNIVGKPFRFLLTCSAVTAGVMFVVGIFVFTDGLRETFEDLAGDIEGNVDLAVRTDVEFGGDFSRPLVDVTLADELTAVPGVIAVQPRIINVGNVTVIDGDGEAQQGTGPNIGFNWEAETPNPRLFLQEGEAPDAPGEFAFDATGFEDGVFEIGGLYDIEGPSGLLEDQELVGTFFFASEDSNASVGAKLVAFDLDYALDIINLGEGYNDITVVLADGISQDEGRARVAEVVGPGFEVLTGADLAQEQQDQFNEIVGIFQTVLLVFAFIILVVSAFVIFNVFSILISQRIRELGLLRAIGATGGQVTTALIGEALLVGVFAMVVGTTLGIGFGWSLRWLLQQVDFGPSGNELVLAPTTFIWGAFVGLVVTLASAVTPALRARHVSPMAALREDARLSRRNPAINIPFGVIVAVAGWALIVLAVADGSWQTIIPLGLIGAFANTFGVRRINATAGRVATLALGAVLLVIAVVSDLDVTPLLSLLGVAAVTLFLGVNSISPFLARPVSHFLGRWPLAMLLGLTGVLVAVLGVGAILGSGYLIALSVGDVVTDFDVAGIVGLIGAFIPLALALAIFWVGYRAIDASFIMGWRFWQVIIGLLIFIVGAIGVSAALVGLAALVTGDTDQIGALVAGVVITAVAWFLRRFVPRAMKSNARMARENAGRAPTRTAAAAAALMIGLALVSTATVVAASFQATFADILEESVTSDWFISPTNNQNPSAGFSNEVATDIAALDEVDTVVSFRFSFEAFVTTFDGLVRDSSATNLAASLEHLDPDFDELDESLLGPDAIWVHRDFADDNGFGIGSTFDIRFNDGAVETVTLAGIYTDSSIYGNRVIDLALWDEHFDASVDQFVSVTLADGVSVEDSRPAIEAATADLTQVNVDTREEFQDRQEGQIDQILIVFNVLLLVAIIIALLGIAITLALSVFERTRELGLVRAVGMTSQQMLRMVLFEGAIIAVFGGVLGVLLGTVFGSAAVVVIPDTFIRTLDIPVASLLQYLAIAAVAGIGAAIIPARRAARLNVLDAISQG
ncbi:MAG: FtsX-like permease family protein [Actinomycetota bacterium]